MLKQAGLLLITALIAFPVRADLYDDGMEAVDRKDYKSAVPLLEKAAIQGNLKAHYQLGLMYLNGEGVAKDPAKALEQFQESGERWAARLRYKEGFPEAQYMLGTMYRDGVGTVKDPEAAAKWFGRAADQGHTESQFALAEIYLKSTELGPDYAEAYFWFTVAQDYLTGEMEEQGKLYLEQAQQKLGPKELETVKQRVAEYEAR